MLKEPVQPFQPVQSRATKVAYDFLRYALRLWNSASHPSRLSSLTNTKLCLSAGIYMVQYVPFHRRRPKTPSRLSDRWSPSNTTSTIKVVQIQT